MVKRVLPVGRRMISARRSSGGEWTEKWSPALVISRDPRIRMRLRNGWDFHHRILFGLPFSRSRSRSRLPRLLHNGAGEKRPGHWGARVLWVSVIAGHAYYKLSKLLIPSFALYIDRGLTAAIYITFLALSSSSLIYHAGLLNEGDSEEGKVGARMHRQGLNELGIESA